MNTTPTDKEDKADKEAEEKIIKDYELLKEEESRIKEAKKEAGKKKRLLNLTNEAGRPKGSKNLEPKGMCFEKRMTVLSRIIKNPNEKTSDRLTAIKIMTDMLADKLSKTPDGTNNNKTTITFEDKEDKINQQLNNNETNNNDTKIATNIDKKDKQDVVKSDTTNNTNTQVAVNQALITNIVNKPVNVDNKVIMDLEDLNETDETLIFNLEIKKDE